VALSEVPAVCIARNHGCAASGPAGPVTVTAVVSRASNCRTWVACPGFVRGAGAGRGRNRCRGACRVVDGRQSAVLGMTDDAGSVCDDLGDALDGQWCLPVADAVHRAVGGGEGQPEPARVHDGQPGYVVGYPAAPDERRDCGMDGVEDLLVLHVRALPVGRVRFGVAPLAALRPVVAATSWVALPHTLPRRHGERHCSSRRSSACGLADPQQ
jgi:hypothetical protein